MPHGTSLPPQYQAPTVRVSLGGDGRLTDHARIERLEHLVELMQGALDTQFARTAAIQAELDVFKADQSR